jgi:hypothetical protein
MLRVKTLLTTGFTIFQFVAEYFKRIQNSDALTAHIYLITNALKGAPFTFS